MLLCSSVSYPNLAHLVKIIFAVGGATSPLDHLEDNVVLQKQKQTHCRSYGDAVSVKSSFKEYGFDYD